MPRKVYGGIEGGGTKFNCVIGTDPNHVLATHTIPTTDPQSTLDAVTRFFQQALQDHKDVELVAVGVGSFGPIDLNPTSATYGYITTTPKSGWQYTNIVGSLKERLGVPVAFDTDVNAAALGEYRWGAAQGSDPSVYITVGTGIGGGIYVNGAPLHGLIHPEMGHLQLPWLDGDNFLRYLSLSHSLLGGRSERSSHCCSRRQTSARSPIRPSRVGDRGTVSSNGDNQYHIYYFTLSYYPRGWCDATGAFVPSNSISCAENYKWVSKPSSCVE